jgi:uncharacterized membrane protein YbhN (UPF0104 family)
MSRSLRLILIIIVTAVCVAAVAWGLDYEASKAAFGSILPFPLLAAGAVMTLQYVARVVRFRLLLGSDAPSWSRVLAACLVGYTAAFMVPLRLGEFVRPWYLSRDGVPMGRALGAVALERVLDMIGLLALIFLASLMVDAPVVEGIDVLRAGRRAAAVVAGGGLLGLIGLGVAGPFVADRLPARLAGFVLSMSESVRELARRPVTAISSVVLTVVVWSLVVLMVYGFCVAFPDVPNRIDTAIALVASTVAGTLVISTPGLVGSFELFARATLALWDVSAEVGTALGIVWHVMVVGSAAIGGWVVLVRDGLSPTEVIRRSRGDSA